LAKWVGSTQICHEITSREYIPDVGLGQRFTIVLDDAGTRFDAFGSQWDVTCHNHITTPCAICDPHIGHIGTVWHNDVFDVWVL
jgi:hypothetical protein